MGGTMTIKPLACGPTASPNSFQRNLFSTMLAASRSMTDIQITVRSKLEAFRNFSGSLPSQYYYRCPSDFVLREGRFFDSRPLPNKIKRGPARECFRNAFLTAIARKLPYVEGYSFNSAGFPLLHAWNLDAEGCVVDTTWVPVGQAYFGVVLPLPLIHSLQGNSVIDDWTNGWPLLKRPWSKTQTVQGTKTRTRSILIPRSAKAR